MTGWRAAALALGFFFAAARVATEQNALRRAASAEALEAKRERVCGFEVLEGCAGGRIVDRRPCSAVVEPSVAGFCDCGGAQFALEVGCGHRPLTCAAACARRRAPEPLRTALKPDWPWKAFDDVQVAAQALCVAFRATRGCAPTGWRDAARDLPCHATVHRGVAGFCECHGGRRVAPVTCDHAPMTCARACLDTPTPPFAPGWEPDDAPEDERTVAVRLAAPYGRRGERVVLEVMRAPALVYGDEALAQLGDDALRDTGQCIAFRFTNDCSPTGGRDPSRDLGCGETVGPQASGYCECGDGLYAAFVACERGRSTTCAEECRLALAAEAAGRTKLLPPEAETQGATNPTARDQRFSPPVPLSTACREFVPTVSCSAAGLRNVEVALGCGELIGDDVSGACVCEEGRIAAFVDCGEARYVNRTCDELCADPAALQREGLRTVGCTGFRATLDCSPDGVRAPHADDACHVPVHSKISGYCECEGSFIGALWGCGHPTKTCAEMCGRFVTAHKGASGDALVPQLDVRCAESEPLSAVIGDVAPDWSPGLGPKAERTASARVSAVWGAVHAAFQAATSGEQEVIMGTRSTLADAVESGHEMEAWQVEAAKRMWAAYRRGMPPYPEDGTFDGRGIAIVGGGLHYMVPAWAAVAALRQQGCTLPIELWFMQHELPTPEMRDELFELGVTVRNLDEFAFDGGAVIQGYQTKAFALFFSRFQEVLLLDADNVAVSDPEVLFGSDAYQSTGALLWPDFWDTSIAPDFFRVHDDVDEKWMRDLVGPGTHESGQVVMDKRRHWRAVLALVYFNALPKLYYRLGSNYMGQGDKETFPWAFAAVGETYHRVDASVLSVGRATSGGPGEPVHMWGLAMGQFHPERPFRLMFMHSNIAKWSLEVPNDFRDYRRMWEATSLAAYAFGPHETEALWIESFGEVLRRFGRSRLDDPEFLGFTAPPLVRFPILHSIPDSTARLGAGLGPGWGRVRDS